MSADGAKAVTIQADSADPAQVGASIEQAVAALGGFDVLVDNAGTTYIAPIAQFPQEQFDRLVAVNIGGVYSAIRSAVGHLGEGSRIISIGSINADRVPVAGSAGYAMTEGAVASLTRGLARDLGQRGITVNNVQPGPIDTDMNPAAGEFADAMRDVMALDRYGHTGDIAAVVSFLAGAESGFVTGANWNVDGGYTARGSPVDGRSVDLMHRSAA